MYIIVLGYSMEVGTNVRGTIFPSSVSGCRDFAAVTVVSRTKMSKNKNKQTNKN